MYIKVTDGNVENYSLYQFKVDNPGVVLPEDGLNDFLSGFGVYECIQKEQPEYDHLTKVPDFGPYYQDDSGQWFQDWTFNDIPEEAASFNVRAKRNEVLAASDWTQLVDSPVDKEAWASYRQELRDLPQQGGFPYSVVWPTEPAS